MSAAVAPPGGPGPRQTGTDGGRYTERTTRSWLSWVARQMQRTNESIFLIERLQPSCLTSNGQRAGYLGLNALAIGSMTGTTFALAWWTSHQFDPPCTAEAHIPWWLWIAVYVVWALAMGALDMWRLLWLTPALHRTTAGRWGAMLLRSGVMFVTSIGLWALVQKIFGAGYASWAGMGPSAVCETSGVALTTLSLGHPLSSSVMVALVYGAKMQGETDVTPVEALKWSWGAAAVGFPLGLLAGLGVWVGYAWSRYAEYGWDGVVGNLKLYPLIGAAAGAIIGGLSVAAVSEKVRPNQGIHLSLRNALKTAALLGGLVAVVAWPVLIFAIGNEKSLHDGWQASFTVGLMAALVGFVWRGGREVILHASLRAVLAMTHQLPVKLAPFLDYCANDLEFMRKVGGGYMFIHRYLLEHFAAGDGTGAASPVR